MSALDGGSGQRWWSRITQITVKIPVSTVTFTLDPTTATVVVKDGGSTVAANTDGTYPLIQGKSYSYTASASGYDSKTGSITPAAATTDVPVTLTESSTGGGSGGSTTNYDVDIVASSNGSVSASKYSAASGDLVTLYVTPADGYAISGLTVTGKSITASSNTNSYTFTMPANDVKVTATFAPVVLTIYSQSGDNGAQVKEAVLTKADLTGLTQHNSAGWAYLYYKTSAWMAVVATDVASFDTLFSFAGISSYWRSSSYVNSYATDGFYTNTSFDTLGEWRYYTDGTNYTEVPAGIATKWNSGDLVGTSYASILAGVYDSGSLRSVYGLTEATYKGPNFAAGARLASQVVKVVLVYDATYVPPGSKDTTHTEDGSGSSGDSSDPSKPADPSKPGTGTLPFTDVSSNEWYYDAVKFVYDNKLFNGTSDTSFSPDMSMTREMLVTVLYRLEGLPAVDGTSSFGDASDPGSYYYNAVIWATKNGVVTGYSDSEFGTGDNVTREQLVTFLYRYAQLKGYDVSATVSLDKFADAGSIQSWALDAMKWAVATGLVKGLDESTLGPAGTATRAQVATILQRYVENIAK
jgi:hypothetical protein